MRISLSKFLHLRFNVFVYERLDLNIVFFYILILGKLYFFLNRKEKRKIEHAVEVVIKSRCNDLEQKSITKNVFRSILLHYYEKVFNAYVHIGQLEKFFSESIQVHYLNKLDNAMRYGKGTLFVTGHYGGIEYIPIFLALKKYPISVIAKFSTEDLKERLYLKTKNLGLKIIDANQKERALSSIIQDLKENRIVFIECDEIDGWRPSHKEQIFFLGKIIGVDRTINIIQRRTGAEVTFGVLHRHNLREYSLIIESYQDIVLQLGRIPSSVGEAVLKHFEQYIYSSPEEWYQWKNYGKLESLSTRLTMIEKSEPLALLKPTLIKIS